MAYFLDLLDALRKGEAVKISELAKEILVTDKDQLNEIEANAFEKFAPCKITPQKSDLYHKRSYIASIKYGDSIYTF